MTPTPSQFQGCILGLALGDALGAPFEGGPVERLLWRFIGTTRSGEMRWTDDTQMSLDVIESLIANSQLDPDDLAARFAASYRWSRGYGPATAKLLKRIARGEPWQRASTAIYREGSFGNGAAMRAPIIGLYFAQDPPALDQAARASAQITHAHPLGIEGAILIARATAAALRHEPNDELLQYASAGCTHEAFLSRLATARDWLTSGHAPAPREVARRLGNGIAAAESSVTAVYLALRFRDAPYLDLHRFTASLRGDVDTINAMSGALWGAIHGLPHLPPDPLAKLEQRDRLLSLALQLHQRASSQP